MRTSNNKRWYLSLAALFCAALCLNAQSFQEGFFLRNYNQAYRYNPAFVGNDFLSILQINNSLQNNVGAKSFLFPMDDGSLVTGLHASVPASTFPGMLPESCRFRGDLNIGLFAYGFRKGDAFHTFELNARVLYGVSVPKQLFELAKLGTGSGTVKVGDFRLDAGLFAELAYGYGRRLNDWLSVGGRAKILLPMYGGLFDISKLYLTASEEELSIGYLGELYATSRKGGMKMFNGAGLAADLGLVATPAEGLTLSLSLLDLGGMYWYYGYRGSSSGPFTFNGFADITSDQLNAQSLKDMLLGKGKELLNVVKPVQLDGKWRWQLLNMEANLGMKYEMPFYRRLAVGATGRYLRTAGLPYWEGRLGLDINPLDWLDLTGNLGYGTHGRVWGVAASVKLGHFRVTGGVQNGFGGTIPKKSILLAPNFKSFSFGLSYDL